MSNNDVIYYNLTIGNNNPATEGLLVSKDIQANITALNNIPIIENPNDYYGSIIRFQIPALTLPLLNVIIQTPVLDINKTIYSFAITDNDNKINGTDPTPANSTQTFVIWKPQVELSPSSLPPIGTPSQTLNEYYLCYSYKWFISLWNTALKSACDLYGGITDYPFFKYEPSTQLISLYSTSQFTTGTGLKIWINNTFLNYFVGCEFVSVNQQTLNNIYGLDNYIVLNNDVLDAVPVITPTIYKNSYEFSAYGYWNFFKSIIITTTMNVNSEAVFNNNQNTTQNVNYINILEDYYPDLALQNGAGVSSQIFTFTATSLYRIFTFNQKSPLYKIDIGISVVDTYGNIYPLILPKGQLANFKMMFIKKDIYASTNKLI
jgi:hypothetical protein